MKPAGGQILLLLATLLPLPLIAEDAARFSSHDLDGDGYISVDEYKQFRQQRRARLQAQQDSGGLRLRHARRAMRFVDIDSNGDGRISENEMLEALDRRFNRPCPGQGRRGRQAD